MNINKQTAARSWMPFHAHHCNSGPDHVPNEFDNGRVDTGPDAVVDEFDNSRSRSGGSSSYDSWSGSYGGGSDYIGGHFIG